MIYMRVRVCCFKFGLGKYLNPAMVKRFYLRHCFPSKISYIYLEKSNNGRGEWSNGKESGYWSMSPYN